MMMLINKLQYVCTWSFCCRTYASTLEMLQHEAFAVVVFHVDEWWWCLATSFLHLRELVRPMHLIRHYLTPFQCHIQVQVEYYKRYSPITLVTCNTSHFPRHSSFASAALIFWPEASASQSVSSPHLRWDVPLITLYALYTTTYRLQFYYGEKSPSIDIAYLFPLSRVLRWVSQRNSDLHTVRDGKDSHFFVAPPSSIEGLHQFLIKFATFMVVIAALFCWTRFSFLQSLPLI